MSTYMRMNQPRNIIAVGVTCDTVCCDDVKILKEYVLGNAVCDFCQEETVCVSTESNKNKKICQNCIYNSVFEVNKPKPPPLNQCTVCLETKTGRVWERDGVKMSVCDDCVFSCVLQITSKNSWIEKNGDPISNLQKEINALKKEAIQIEQLKDTLKDELRDEIRDYIICEVRGK